MMQAEPPKHIAVIMDGNGRWAQNRSRPRIWGHRQGVDAVRRTVRVCIEQGVPHLTLFAFSSENWHRPEDEVSGLMNLFLKVLTSEVKSLNKNGVRLNIIGDISRFSPKLQSQIQLAQDMTASNETLVLNIAANYGGQWDIAQAAKNLAYQVAEGKIQPQDINESLLGKHLSLSCQPDVDLLIRTGGDYRISNFLLWHLAYAEMYFTQTLWPDFSEEELINAIRAFHCRERRFGQTSQQIQEFAFHG
ncbi:polyprenyl diphosphate synthase [Algicola sagamiensis]|uniref:polyprenyl diphosphate synthase n=1 Tax=Algicola sagamiensis TaxID=163869 RepID=UPI001FE17DA3|nr:polyprenyl diphosphate synthase [Algicola sagamiensis]